MCQPSEKWPINQFCIAEIFNPTLQPDFVPPLGILLGCFSWLPVLARETRACQICLQLCGKLSQTDVHVCMAESSA